MTEKKLDCGKCDVKRKGDGCSFFLDRVKAHKPLGCCPGCRTTEQLAELRTELRGNSVDKLETSAYRAGL